MLSEYLLLYLQLLFPDSVLQFQFISTLFFDRIVFPFLRTALYMSSVSLTQVEKIFIRCFFSKLKIFYGNNALFFPKDYL